MKAETEVHICTAVVGFVLFIIGGLWISNPMNSGQQAGVLVWFLGIMLLAVGGILARAIVEIKFQ